MTPAKITNHVNVNQIYVNSIDTSSGIFVGTNYANNWSSHRKNNYGFGSISHSQVSNNYSYVMDNDVIDTPIQNNPTILLDGHMAENQNDIDIGQININVLDTCAAVSVGENELTGWSSHSKRNAGQGRFTGEVHNTQNSSLILDADVIDCEINDNR
ncbi:hypothetical protein [Pseudobacillus wudalianchiensis]|uniref:Uncharacterized protein n=1 Tax=Pseudobacillus wudalianchiensis TaxID=1743143 RepID=A0A1B9AN58_9BACI|nr:hypothetical protein [Bacillus wudalianchiensis]OCA85078.1 hypothetical protein A8F95_10330 [Bacillus wudalianchiensis]